MPFNVLVLPLIGGYIVASTWHRTSYKMSRHSGQWLLFTAAWYGLWLLLAAVLVVHWGEGWYTEHVRVARDRDLVFEHNLLRYLRIAGFRVAGEVTDFLSGDLIEGRQVDYLGTSLLALLLAYPFAVLANMASPKKRTLRRIVTKEGDAFEKLLLGAIDQEKYVCAVLANGKVYIGHVTSNFDPSRERKFFSMLPAMSGVRKGEDKRLEITEEYTDVIDSVARGRELGHVDIDDLKKIIPIHSIQTINLFDLEVFGRFPGSNSFPSPDHLFSSSSSGQQIEESNRCHAVYALAAILIACFVRSR